MPHSEPSTPKPTVAVIGSLRFPPEQLQEIRPHFKSLIEATHQNDGCIAYDVGEDPFDAGLIRFSELWPDRETLARHLQATHIEPWRSAVRQCGLIVREFTAYDISGSNPI